MVDFGSLPEDLGLIDLDPVEMLCWLYCPISLPGLWVKSLPANLKQFKPIVDAVWEHIGEKKWDESYVYITAKTLFVSPENPGNRPGWHSDGFMTNDLNFVWSDSSSTIFLGVRRLCKAPNGL